MRTAVAMISRANGNSSRGHSIMTIGCRLFLRHVLDAENAGKDQLEAEQQHARNSALPSRRNVTSTSVGLIGAALTLTWMLMLGCWPAGWGSSTAARSDSRTTDPCMYCPAARRFAASLAAADAVTL